MSWYDRDYYRTQSDGYRGGFGGFSGFGLPRPTRLVTWLLIGNVAAFVLTAICGPLNNSNPLYVAGSLKSIRSDVAWELWRFVTYQFLHGGTWHLFANMLGLYFFGPPLERTWGPRRFVLFCFGCGIVGGLTFWVLGGWADPGSYLIGASGAVLGLLTACAVLFPGMMIILLFFPVPIRVAAVLLVGLYTLSLLSTRSLADACHLGGMAAAYVYIRSQRWQHQVSARRRQQHWQRAMAEEQRDQEIVDRILEKIHEHGMQSLTWWEKRALRRATERQRQRERLSRR